MPACPSYALMPHDEDLACESGEDQELLHETFHDRGVGQRPRRVWAKSVLAVLGAGAAVLALGLEGSRQLASGFDRGHAAGHLDFSSEGNPFDHCADVFNTFAKGDLSKNIKVGVMDGTSLEVKETSGLDTFKAVAKAINNPQTDFAHIGECSPDNKAVVWLYTSASGDKAKTGSAFLIADGECSRQEMLGGAADCLAFYRDPSAEVMTNVLKKWHSPNTIIHAVIGGHGSEASQEGAKDGVLVVADGKELSAADSKTKELFATIQERLAGPTATIFLDSCFGGKNGMAEAVSNAIPKNWVMGGIVSLSSELKVIETSASGGEDGPVRVVSEQIAQEGGKEEIVAWYGGKLKGLVTQWMGEDSSSKAPAPAPAQEEEEEEEAPAEEATEQEEVPAEE